jgi:hypothetical protein
LRDLDHRLVALVLSRLTKRSKFHPARELAKLYADVFRRIQEPCGFQPMSPRVGKAGSGAAFKYYSETITIGRSARTLRACNSPILLAVHLSWQRSRRQWRTATAGDLMFRIARFDF